MTNRWKTVPVDPTPEMVDELITVTHRTDSPIAGLRAAIAAAPEQPVQEPYLFTIVFPGDERPNLSTVFDEASEAADYAEKCQSGVRVIPLFTTPPDTDKLLRQALELIEAVKTVVADSTDLLESLKTWSNVDDLLWMQYGAKRLEANTAALDKWLSHQSEQPVQEPVTDEENEQFSLNVSSFKGADPEATKFALEQFLKNRATPPEPKQPVQEPVYWQWRRSDQPWSLEYTFNSEVQVTAPNTERRALYTTPPDTTALLQEIERLNKANDNLFSLGEKMHKTIGQLQRSESSWAVKMAEAYSTIDSQTPLLRQALGVLEMDMVSHYDTQQAITAIRKHLGDL